MFLFLCHIDWRYDGTKSVYNSTGAALKYIYTDDNIPVSLENTMEFVWDIESYVSMFPWMN
eukprot:1666791-Ditylum_brightwellii.AAC.1